MQNIQDKLTLRLENIIKLKCKNINNPIFIVSGLTDYVDLFKYEDHLADVSTFDEDGNSDYFDKEWFFKIFTKIAKATDYIIITHQQYSYIIENINSEYFLERSILIYDNLRSLYPMFEDEYLEKVSDDRLELRPDDMPVYQAEQLKIGDKYYYSLRSIDEVKEKIPFFINEKNILPANIESTNSMVVDISSDPFALDFFINECIEKKTFSCKYIIKTYANSLIIKI